MANPAAAEVCKSFATQTLLLSAVQQWRKQHQQQQQQQWHFTACRKGGKKCKSSVQHNIASVFWPKVGSSKEF